MRYYRPDGELVWLNVDAYPLFQSGHPAPYAISVNLTRHTAEIDQPQARSSAANFIRVTPTQAKAGLNLQGLYERHWQVLFQSLPIGVVLVDPTNAAILEFNDAAATHLGYTREEFGQLTIADIEGLQDRATVLNSCQHIVGHLAQTTVQTQHRTKSGARRDVMVIAHPIEIDDRVFAYGIWIDITERKATEAALQESESQNRTILDSISDGFVALDAEWRFTYINQVAEQIIGRIAPDLIGKTIWEEFPGISSSEFGRIYQETMQNRTVGSATAFYPEHDRWYEARSYPAASGITVYFKNITDQVEAETVLRQSEAFKHRLLESSPDCIKLLDLDGRLLYMNAGGICVMEVDDFTSYCNTEWVSFWQGDDQQAAERALELARVGEASVFRGYCPTAKGTPKWWEVIVSPILDAAGQVEQILSVSRDISDRVQLERDREQILQQEQAAREASDRANHIKDEFLAVLSHELRSPLNPILGWSKMLKTRRLSEAKTQEAASIIERNAQLQAQLIEDLLDISRILQSKLTLNRAPVNLEFVITSAQETVRLAAAAKSITITTDFESSIGPVLGDAGRLQQVLWNLLTNAVKFTPESGQVTVRLARIGSQAQIQVIDAGKGISPEFVPHVFERFRQADSSTTRKFGGLGLGLAIVRQLVELHGGTVIAESQGEDQGATFTILLPLLDSIENQFTDMSDGAALDCIGECPLSGYQFLVVDDEPDSREIVAFILEQAGAVVTQTASAAQALELLSRDRFDALVSDIGMPEMNGYSLIQQVRAKPPEQGGQIPAIALTAYAGESNAQKAMQAGFERHLAKPIDPEPLVLLMVELLSVTIPKRGDRGINGSK